MPTWSNVIPVWSGPQPETTANSVALPGVTFQTLLPSVTKRSRGVDGAGVAEAELNGAIAMYFSRQSLGKSVGIVAYTEVDPSQLTFLMFVRAGRSGWAQ